jgi:hypothetical protein
MPRRSAASLAIVRPVSTRRRLAPSADAPEDVVVVFREILAATAADHFRPGDAPLIQAYADAIYLARRAAVELDRHGPVIAGRTSPWLTVQEKAHRAIAALSARLRLSPQHRLESKVAGRRADGPRPSVYDTMGMGDGED